MIYDDEELRVVNDGCDNAGVHGVELDVGKGEIKVKGVIDVIKIHKMIEKVSKKKVEILSPQIKTTDKDKAAATPSKPKETKKVIYSLPPPN